MKRKAITGLVVVRQAEPVSKRELAARMKMAARRVGPGRFLAVLHELHHGFGACSPVDAWVVETILGTSGRRRPGDEGFRFFDQLTIRTFGKDPREPVRTLGCVIMQRSGPPPFKRRKDPFTPVRRDRLNTTALAFTRDVANNIWHVRDAGAERTIVRRLARICCWSDEKVIEIEVDGSIVPFDGREGRFPDLVPHATKVPYAWADRRHRRINTEKSMT